GLMRGAPGGQARAEVEELADAVLAGHPAGRAVVEAAVRPGRVAELGQPAAELLGDLPVDREVAGPAQVIVVEASRGGHGRIDARRRLLRLGHVTSMRSCAGISARLPRYPGRRNSPGPWRADAGWLMASPAGHAVFPGPLPS